MTTFRWPTLLGRNLRHHRRGNFAVLLGVAVGTAVLVGALLVGDSLRGSLRERVLDRLGGVEQAVVLPRLIDVPPLAEGFEPALLLRGSVEVEGPTGVRRAADVTVRGDARSPGGDAAVVSAGLARDLGITEGTTIRVRVPRFSAIARDSLLGRKTASDITQTLELPATIAPPESRPSRFDLSPGVGPVRAVVINLTSLQSKLGLGNQVNAILGSTGQPLTLGGRLADYGFALRTPDSRTSALLTLLDRDKSGTLEPREYRRRLGDDMIRQVDADGNKTLRRDELLAYFRSRGTIDLEAQGLLINSAGEQAAGAAGRALGVPTAPALVYLANAISDGSATIPYSTIVAVDPQRPPPLGPYLDPTAPPLADDEILLADWPESPLTARPGARIRVTYFLPDSDGTAKEATAEFKLRGTVPLAGIGADPYLAPEFPGITDKLTLGEWDPPFPYDNTKITKRDDDYWDKYRSAPKAYVNLAAGRKLFGSRFGAATSVRFATLDAPAVEAALLKQLRPADFGLTTEPVRAKALAASQSGTDFGGLFLGFSSFLVIAALMLVGLLSKLNLETRASELGLLLAVGHTERQVRWLYLAEGLLVAIGGAVVGLALAIAYSAGLLRLLAALWPDGDLGGILRLHVTPTSLAIGFVAIVLLVGVVIALSLRWLRRVPPVMLLRGVTSDPLASEPERQRRGRRGAMLAALSGLGGVGVTLAGIGLTGHEARAGAFFGGGALLLVAGLLAFRQWLLRQERRDVAPAGSASVLGRRNSARHPGRSLLTAGLLASAAFMLIAVESFRRQPAADFAKKEGGSGGFDLVCQLEVPLHQDPNDPATGRREILDGLDREYQRDPATKTARLQAAEQLLAASTLIPVRVRPGDDAGCRNLARPDRPKLIGLPSRFLERGGFHIHTLLGDPLANPWQRLTQSDESTPVFAEASSAQWMLKLPLGGELSLLDARGRPAKLRLVGTLQDSIFQGELLMSEARFLELFPETSGHAMLLAIAPPGRVAELRSLLETGLSDYGLTATPAYDRVGPYLAVENTYLSTFQILGGLGLLLGSCGLAVVLMRAAAERRGELALLRAVGWPVQSVMTMVRAENGLLALVGLGVGTVAALIGIAPMLVTHEASLMPLGRVAVLLLAAMVAAWLAGGWATRVALRAPIVAALRRE